MVTPAVSATNVCYMTVLIITRMTMFMAPLFFFQMTKVTSLNSHPNLYTSPGHQLLTVFHMKATTTPQPYLPEQTPMHPNKTKLALKYARPT